MKKQTKNQVRCAKCKNPFQRHHKGWEFKGEMYHTGCVPLPTEKDLVEKCVCEPDSGANMGTNHMSYCPLSGKNYRPRIAEKDPDPRLVKMGDGYVWNGNAEKDSVENLVQKLDDLVDKELAKPSRFTENVQSRGERLEQLLLKEDFESIKQFISSEIQRAVESERRRIENELKKVAMYHHLETYTAKEIPVYAVQDVLDILEKIK